MTHTKGPTKQVVGKLTPKQYRLRTAELRELLDKIDERCNPTTSLERRMLSNAGGSKAGGARDACAGR